MKIYNVYFSLSSSRKAYKEGIFSSLDKAKQFIAENYEKLIDHNVFIEIKKLDDPSYMKLAHEEE